MFFQISGIHYPQLILLSGNSQLKVQSSSMLEKKMFWILRANIILRKKFSWTYTECYTKFLIMNHCKGKTTKFDLA